jgi:hypothetical protein
VPPYRTRSQAVLQLAKETPLFAFLEDMKEKACTSGKSALISAKGSIATS